MKSKMSATRIRPPTRYSIDALSVLDHDAFEHVGNVLTAVGRVFEEVERLFPLDHDERIVLFVEQSHDGMLMHAIRLVLEPVELVGERLKVGIEFFFSGNQPKGHKDAGL